jgi:hypothetical protein
MFGMDPDDPGSCAADLAARGFRGVVLSAATEPALEAAQQHGLDAYLCFGAFGLRSDADEASLAHDVDGIPRVWFSSGCPNDPGLAESRLEQACRAAGKPGLRGIFVDGARFASPASPEGFDAFWTCFCPRCVRKAGDMGMDAGAMEKAVRAMIRFIERGEGVLEQCLSGMADWLRFRKRCIGEYFARFRTAVRESRSDLAAGAFVFTPSLRALVGQDAETVSGLDIVAPMIYRRYPHKNGPSCLDHEWAALLGAITARSGISFETARAAMRLLSDIPIAAQSAAQLLKEGFPPQVLESETAAARVGLPEGAALMPIVQLEDDRLDECVAAIRRGGAVGCGFFRWRKEHMGSLPELLLGLPPERSARRKAEKSGAARRVRRGFRAGLR